MADEIIYGEIHIYRQGSFDETDEIDEIDET